MLSPMTIRLGTDIVYIPGLTKIVSSDKIMQRIFHQRELGSQEHLAGIIAAKEAYFKALGKKPRFLEIEITHERSGRPRITTMGTPPYQSCDVSISHDKDYATATVILDI